MPAFQSIVLTGAGRGIGAALARALAAPGVTLLLVARDAQRLALVAAQCAAEGATVHQAAIDVTDSDALGAAILAFDREHPVDLVLANAGVSGGLGEDRTAEALTVAMAQLDVNLGGEIAAVTPLIEPMRRRGRGQIALMSSIAGFHPVPDTPAYCASKAGVLMWGRCLDAWLRPQGVAVSVICPGFVKTDMNDRYIGWKPFLMTADRAAAIIVRGLARRRRVIAFPWQLVALVRAAGLVPPEVVALFMKLFAAKVEPDSKAPGGV
jgi:short-subunit dehydrogenase